MLYLSALPATEQLLFVAHAAKVWLPAPLRRRHAMTSPSPPIYTGDSTKTVHFRCRIIFLSSCIVFEPTLEGDKCLAATSPHPVIDLFRILGVQAVADGGAGGICCSSLDLLLLRRRRQTASFAVCLRHSPVTDAGAGRRRPPRVAYVSRSTPTVNDSSAGRRRQTAKLFAVCRRRPELLGRRRQTASLTNFAVDADKLRVLSASFTGE